MGAEHRRRQAPRLLAVVGVLVLAGFLFAASARLGQATRDPQDLRGLVQAELIRSDAAAQEVADLSAQVESLSEELAGLGSADAGAGPDVALAAGWVAVGGPGVEVRLWDAPAGAARPDWATNDDLVVHQQDVQAVMNALWAGGAEAMALQDQRVVSTSAFRCVGNVMLLHGRTYSPPYVVRAIGDPEELLDALADSPAVQVYLDYVDVVGLGWSATEADDLELPAYEGAAELAHAAAADGAQG